VPRRPGVVDSEKYERARELRAAGHSLAAIAKDTGAAYSTVHGWTRDVRPDLARSAEHTEAIRRGRERSVAGIADEIERGGCGTPGCPDPDCSRTYGLCHCGCGEAAPISGLTDRGRGYIEGKPHRFVLGHNRRGLSPAPLSEEGRRILSESMAAKRSDGTIGTAQLSPASQRRWRLGTGLRNLVSFYSGPKRRRWLNRWNGLEGGRPRLDARRDYDEALQKIRDKYGETHASERDLERLTGESRTMVRLALGRAV
jgi:hypothetical protein